MTTCGQIGEMRIWQYGNLRILIFDFWHLGFVVLCVVDLYNLDFCVCGTAFTIVKTIVEMKVPILIRCVPFFLTDEKHF